ncbi:MAG: Flp pilus assembly protein CpaB [Bryobacteraceae bacterium]
MKKNLVPLLGIAFVVAILATGVFYGLFVSKMQDVNHQGDGGSVVVAVKVLQSGVKLQAADLKTVPWPGSAPLKGAVGSVEEMEGATLLQAVQENQPVLISMVATAAGQAGGGVKVPSGMRAVSTRVPDSDGVVDLLQGGHHVDVQIVSAGSSAPELRTLLQNVEVLRVEASKEQRGSPVVTLLVTPEEADALSLADAAAKVRLILRNPLDGAHNNLPRLTLPPLFQNGVAPRKRQAPPAAKK